MPAGRPASIGDCTAASPPRIASRVRPSWGAAPAHHPQPPPSRAELVMRPARAAVAAGQLDPVVLDLVHCSDMAALGADDLHVLADLAGPVQNGRGGAGMQ